MTNYNERIFITGPGGVGKSTYAKDLAKQKNLKLYHLDHMRYPNRDGSVSSIDERLPEEIFREKVKRVVSKETWIIEGTLKNKQDVIFPRCTKIIVLTAPRIVCTFRTLKRTIKRALKIEKSEVFNDLSSLFSKDFIVFWVWRNYPRYIRQIEKALDETPHNAEVIRKKV